MIKEYILRIGSVPLSVDGGLEDACGQKLAFASSTVEGATRFPRIGDAMRAAVEISKTLRISGIVNIIQI